MRFQVAFLAALLLAGCESNEKKIQRLQSEELTACLVEEADLNALDSLKHVYKSHDSLYSLALDKWGKQRNKCQLAKRDLNLFMNGR